MVDTVGVRYRGWIFANADGIALYTAIDSVVRAVGRIVVWVDAAAEDSTMSSSRWVRNDPNGEVPNTRLPWMDSTSPAFATLPRPLPVVLIPAKDCMEKMTRAYVHSRMNVDRIAARPGVLFLSLVSSLTASAVSQP